MLLLERVTDSAAGTEALAAEFAARLRAGSTWLLSGDLGAGKTAFVRGLCRGLGVTDQVRSPTFTLVTNYRGGRLPVVHIDLYRLEDIMEIARLGWDDLAPENAVVVVEWGERARPLVGEDCFAVEIRHRGGDGRSIRIGVSGSAAEALGSEPALGIPC